MKKCSVCLQLKQLSSFRNDSSRKDGKCYVCTDCKRIEESIWRNNKRDKIRKKQREYYFKNKEKIKEKRKLNYDPIKGKARWLAKKIKAKKCIFCNNIGERHHKDYNHPLDIVFLCKSHHKMVHDGTIKL